MKIRTGLSAGPDRWLAVDDDSDDGHHVGYGETEEEAIADLKRLLTEKAEADEEDASCSK